MIERSTGPAETEAIAQRLAERLRPGDVVLVRGELGAGKTTFVRGACRALGVAEPVTSPTFTIGQRYRGRIPISHLDLYRLAEPSLEEPGLLDEYLDEGGIAFVEWPRDAGAGLAGLGSRPVEPALVVELRHAGGDEREIRVHGPPARSGP